MAGKQPPKDRVLNLRTRSGTIKMLDAIAKQRRSNRTKVIEQLIVQEYADSLMKEDP